MDAASFPKSDRLVFTGDFLEGHMRRAFRRQGVYKNFILNRVKKYARRVAMIYKKLILMDYFDFRQCIRIIYLSPSFHQFSTYGHGIVISPLGIMADEPAEPLDVLEGTVAGCCARSKFRYRQTIRKTVGLS